MAKIKLSGYQELLEISQKKAIQLKSIWMDKSIPSNEKIDIGVTVCEKSQIKAIFLDEDLNKRDEAQEQLDKFYKWRDGLLMMEPAQRTANCGTWGYFSLFYRGVYGEYPSEEKWRQKTYDIVTTFFEKNPQWGRPSIRVFEEMLGLDSNTPINGMILRMCQRIEDRELSDIEQTIDYEGRKRQKEIRQIPDEEQDINLEAMFV